MNFAPNKQPYKTNTNEYFFSLTFFFKYLLCYKKIFKGHLSRSNHLFFFEPVLLLFLFDTSSDYLWLLMLKFVLVLIYETNRISDDIYCNYWFVRQFNSHDIFCPSYFCFKIFFTTVKWQTIKIMNLQHITLIFVLIILFLFFNVF